MAVGLYRTNEERKQSVKVLVGGALIIGLSVIGAAAKETVRTQKGYAAHYSPNVMERVSKNRGMPIVDCMIATPRGPLGEWVTVESRLTGAVKECRITDIAHPRDRANIEKRGIVAEFGYANIKEMCNLNYYGEEPPRACPVTLYWSK